MPQDLDVVVEIDFALTGRSRRTFFEKRLAAALAAPGRHVHIGARQGGALVGYALARMTDGEFGGGAPTATLDSIGVAEGRRGLGVGRLLLEGVEAVLARKGVGEIVTEVDWGDQALLHFFEHGGFELAPRVVLARSAAAPMNI
jgi:ribosomal protein S18 acetylase RimI-like enzyme